MARINRVAGLQNPLQEVFPLPVAATRNPGVSDTAYELGQVWINKTTNGGFILTGFTAGEATWSPISGSSGDLYTLTPDSGGMVTPVAGNIDLDGGNNVTTVGTAGTITIDVDGNVADQFDTDSGSAIPALGVLNIIGTSLQGISTAGATDTVTLTVADATTTQKGVLETATDAEAIAVTATDVALTPGNMGPLLASPPPVGSTAPNTGEFTTLTATTSLFLSTATPNALPYYTTSGEFTEIGPLTNGQLLIGDTGNPPAAATLASGDGTITITNGAGTIDLAVTSGAGFAWNVETGTTATLAANNGYIGNNAAGVTFTLPATCAVGERFIVTGLQASWTIDQGTGQTIYFGNQSTTTTSGTLVSTHARDVVEFICVVTDTDFQVLSSVGNITVT